MAEGSGYGNFGASLVIATTEDEFFREKKTIFLLQMRETEGS
jgi:hypothetical protein